MLVRERFADGHFLLKHCTEDYNVEGTLKTSSKYGCGQIVGSKKVRPDRCSLVDRCFHLLYLFSIRITTAILPESRFVLVNLWDSAVKLNATWVSSLSCRRKSKLLVSFSRRAALDMLTATS